MQKNKLFLTALLLANYAYADTKPVHFDIGDIAPRQKVTFNVNVPKWAGYHDIQCDITDPSSAAIVRISSDDSAVSSININQTKYSSFPLQVALKDQQNQLVLYKTYNWSDSSTNGANNITFENLDDDVTISVKNCEISPTAILSKDYIYFPSKITCTAGTCKMEGGSSDKWDPVTAPDGTYFFSSAAYYIVYNDDGNVSANYTTSDYSLFLTVNSSNYIPITGTSTSWILSSSTSENCMSPYNSVAYCPVKAKT